MIAGRLWEGFIKKLLQKDYKFDAGFYGSLNEFSRKVAYFFHISLQTPAGYPGLTDALRHVADSGLKQGLLADGQCFTTVQLQRCVCRQVEAAKLDELIDSELHTLSCEVRGRKPSERLFRHSMDLLEKKGISPGEVLEAPGTMSLRARI